jgi:flavocytochrome c
LNFMNWAFIGLLILLISIICYQNRHLVMSEIFSTENQNKSVIIVGGGLAGSIAALEAGRNGATVFLLDKEKRFGGNSAKASSGMNAALSDLQRKLGISDSYDLFYKDTISSGKGLSNENLVKILTSQSTKAFDYLTSTVGLDFSEISQCGGHSVARTHRTSMSGDKLVNVGSAIIGKVHLKLQSMKNVQLLANSKVTELLASAEKGGKIIGVEYEHLLEGGKKSKLLADAVILTTGGFSCSMELLQKVAPKVASLPTTNGAWTTGDGIFLGEKVGAQTIDMGQVQVHPTGLLNPKNPGSKSVFLGPEALRAYGAILVDKNGLRFVNELGLRDHVSNAILKHGSSDIFPNSFTVAFLIMNSEIEQKFGKPLFDFYTAFGLIEKFQNLEEFAKKFGISYETLKNTMEKYNSHYIDKTIDEFNKTLFPTSFSLDSAYYVAFATPSVHYTMGGLKIDENSRVLGKDGNLIPNLYAAGEATGGVHGANRLAGNSLLECVVFGIIAGSCSSRPQ